MPEYLAPGVYVEEIDTGTKPIEGVSTSTAGLVGVTERGPVDVPHLVTSSGEYHALFGGTLPPTSSATAAAGSTASCRTPSKGFFTNGGKRTYVTRVLPEGARDAHRDVLPIRPWPTRRTHAAAPRAAGHGHCRQPAALYVLDPRTSRRRRRSRRRRQPRASTASRRR